MAYKVARYLLVLVAAASITVLAGCFPSSAPVDPPGTGTPSPSPSPSTPAPSAPGPTGAVPTDDARVTEIYITAEVIEFHDRDGAVVSTFDYFQPTEEVLYALTEVFGTAPVSEPYKHNHGSGIGHTWDGFHLTDPSYASAPYAPSHFVGVTAESVHGVHVRTIDGIAIGDSAPEVEAAHPHESERFTYPNGVELLQIFVGTVRLPDQEAAAGVEHNFTVGIYMDNPDGVVINIGAPTPNFGA